MPLNNPEPFSGDRILQPPSPQGPADPAEADALYAAAVNLFCLAKDSITQEIDTELAEIKQALGDALAVEIEAFDVDLIDCAQTTNVVVARIYAEVDHEILEVVTRLYWLGEEIPAEWFPYGPPTDPPEWMGGTPRPRRGRGSTGNAIPSPGNQPARDPLRSADTPAQDLGELPGPGRPGLENRGDVRPDVADPRLVDRTGSDATATQGIRSPTEPNLSLASGGNLGALPQGRAPGISPPISIRPEIAPSAVQIGGSSAPKTPLIETGTPSRLTPAEAEKRRILGNPFTAARIQAAFDASQRAKAAEEAIAGPETGLEEPISADVEPEPPDLTPAAKEPAIGLRTFDGYIDEPPGQRIKTRLLPGTEFQQSATASAGNGTTRPSAGRGAVAGISTSPPVLDDEIGDRIWKEIGAGPEPTEACKWFGCLDLVFFRGELVKLGASLMGAVGKPNWDTVLAFRSIVNFFDRWKPDYWPKVSEYLGSALWDVMRGENGERYRSFMQSLPPRAASHAPETAYLCAAVQYLEFLAGLNLTLQYQRVAAQGGAKGGGVSANVSPGAAVPQIGGAGIGFGGSKTDQRNYAGHGAVGFTANLQDFVVPLLGVARWLRDHADQGSPPTPAEILAAYLRGGMGDGEFGCWKCLLGMNDELWGQLLYASRAGLTPLDYIHAFRRKLISLEEMTKLIRNAGVLDGQDRKLLWQLSEEIPPITDLIRFMVRDVEDKNVIKRFELDAEFPDKWKDRLKEWGYAQGINDDVALRYWRAHWRLPGLEQVYRTLHRLRPDHPDPEIAKLAVTKADVMALLAQDDIPLFWRERLESISYHPLNRVDLFRMRRMGVLTIEEVEAGFRDQGYDAKNAKRMAAFAESLRLDGLRRDRASRQYARGELGEDGLLANLERFRVLPAEYEALKTELDRERVGLNRRRCVQATSKAYLKGGLSAEQAAAKLKDYGFDALHAIAQVRLWNCQLPAADKQIAAAQLCKWYSLNLLTAEEMRTRLVRLGYAGVDAVRIVKACEMGPIQRLRDSTDRQRDKVKKDLDKAEAKLKSKEEKAARDAHRTERQRDTAAAAEARRRRKLLASAEYLRGPSGMTLEESSERIAQLIVGLMKSHSLAEKEAESLVIDALARWDPAKHGTLEEYAEDLADVEENFDLD